MSNHDPYAPPESRVASDPPANPKLLKQLLDAWPDDTKMLNGLRRFRFVYIIIFVVAATNVAMVFHDRLALDALALAIAVLGGIAFGLTFYLDSALRQWPTLKNYFDWERMQRDHQDSAER